MDGIPNAVDRYWAGMLAGGASCIFVEDANSSRTRCAANGKESCEFVINQTN